MLQAESEKLRQAWIQAVQASIASAYKDIADNYYIEVRTHDFTRSNDHMVVFLRRISDTATSVSAAFRPDGIALHQQHRLRQRAQRAWGEGW